MNENSHKMPWLCQKNAVHFYLKRSKGFTVGASLDMQKIDMGITLCHFDLDAKENGLNTVFQ